MPVCDAFHHLNNANQSRKMNSELSFDYRITDSVRPGDTAIWKAIAVTAVCTAFAILLLISAKDVYRVLPDPGLLMDPPVFQSSDQQYAIAAPVVRLGN
jgi:hypothetical protein